MLSLESSPPLALKLSLPREFPRSTSQPFLQKERLSLHNEKEHAYCFAETISPQSLAKLLEESPRKSPELVIIDLRGRHHHSKGYIKEAILGSYSSSKLSISKTLSFVKTVLAENKQAARQNVIIYTNSFLDTKRNCDAIENIVAHLKRPTNRIRLLEGGYEEFWLYFGHLCEKESTPLSLSINQREEASEIFPFLYLGDEVDASDETALHNRGIGHVINATSELPRENAGQLCYCRLPLIDSPVENLRQYLPEAFVFIENARCKGSRVLVHCQAGVSRSAALVIAYVMAYSELGLHEAFQTIRSRRPMISPNFGFLGQLIEFEEDLKKGHFERHSTLHDGCYVARN